MLSYVCFPFLCLVKFYSGCFRQVFFHLGDKKRWSLVALHRWLYYTVTIVWEFAWTDSTLVVVDKWLSYRGGSLNRFDCRKLNLLLINMINLLLSYVKKTHVDQSIYKCFLSCLKRKILQNLKSSSC